MEYSFGKWKSEIMLDRYLVPVLYSKYFQRVKQFVQEFIWIGFVFTWNNVPSLWSLRSQNDSAMAAATATATGVIHDH